MLDEGTTLPSLMATMLQRGKLSAITAKKRTCILAVT
jgi:hypothetical protein